MRAIGAGMTPIVQTLFDAETEREIWATAWRERETSPFWPARSVVAESIPGVATSTVRLSGARIPAPVAPGEISFEEFVDLVALVFGSLAS